MKALKVQYVILEKRVIVKSHSQTFNRFNRLLLSHQWHFCLSHLCWCLTTSCKVISGEPSFIIPRTSQDDEAVVRDVSLLLPTAGFRWLSSTTWLLGYPSSCFV